jgi:hypothetical protein
MLKEPDFEEKSNCWELLFLGNPIFSKTEKDFVCLEVERTLAYTGFACSFFC